MVRKHRAGFTIVEIIVTVVVLTILTTLVVVRLRLTQASGRDQERQIDATTIATGLEVYYENGDRILNIPEGYYPGAAQIATAASSTPTYRDFLDGVSAISLTAPDRTIDDSFGVDPNYATAPVGSESDGSYSSAQASPLLNTYPYLYQPLRRNKTFCVNYTDCVKFNLYYKLESPNDACLPPDRLVCVIRSKNQ